MSLGLLLPLFMRLAATKFNFGRKSGKYCAKAYPPPKITVWKVTKINGVPSRRLLTYLP